MENHPRREFTFLRSRDFLGRHNNLGGTDPTAVDNSMECSQPMIKEMDFFSGASDIAAGTDKKHPHDDRHENHETKDESSTQVSDPGVNVRFSISCCYLSVRCICRPAVRSYAF